MILSPYEKHPILLSRISVNPLLMVSGGRDCYPDFIYTQYVYTICVHLKVGTSLTRTDELQNMTRPVQTYSHKSNPRTGLVVCSVLHTRKIRWGGAGQGWDVNTFTCTCTHTHTVTLHTFSESSHTFLMLRYIRLLYSTLYTCTILHTYLMLRYTRFR